MISSMGARVGSWLLRPRSGPLRGLLLGGLLATLPLGGCGGGGAGDPRGGDYLLDPSKAHYGASFARWSQRWWQWAYELPATNHPLLDPVGTNAAVGQTDPVWFLGSEFCSLYEPCDGVATREITIPAGKALFFPLVNVSWTNQECVEPDTTLTYTELRKLSADTVEGATDIFLSIDGDVVVDSPTFLGAQIYRAQTEEFSYHVPADSLFLQICNDTVVDVDHDPCAGDGLYVMISPLPVGTHTIRFGGAFPSLGFTTDAQSTIHVLP